MLGFPCAKCGQLEIAHSSDLDYFLERGLWPTLEYGEEVTRKEVDTLFEKKRGYRFHLKSCPGFQYSKCVSTEQQIISAMDHPSALYYLEESVAQEARRRLEEIHNKETDRHAAYGGCTTYIVYQGGSSRVFIGE